jgi:solute carrier family 8 (sodium/calcium exchanger)
LERIDKMLVNLKTTWEKSKIGHDNWADQFRALLYVNGGEEEPNQDDDDEGAEPDEPSVQDKVMHFVTLPWKLLFAFCPPVDYCGGWVCFGCSLVMIGLVTVIIGDFANLFGCVIPGMQNEITAITFVALGTSLPDTFASMSAAQQDPYADASVGNVTGSNSVNVFLGLGLPWTVASFFWWYRGPDAEWDARYQEDPDLSWLGEIGHRRQAYVVKAGSLAFSVTVFAICAGMALGLLAVRRRHFGGELGGPRTAKFLSTGFLVTLWFVYILMSILNVKGAT